MSFGFATPSKKQGGGSTNMPCVDSLGAHQIRDVGVDIFTDICLEPQSASKNGYRYRYPVFRGSCPIFIRFLRYFGVSKYLPQGRAAK